jgi:predicted RNA-binding Zn-ribbon protein involved in translation (DUF1610 family)
MYRKASTDFLCPLCNEYLVSRNTTYRELKVKEGTIGVCLKCWNLLEAAMRYYGTHSSTGKKDEVNKVVVV